MHPQINEFLINAQVELAIQFARQNNFQKECYYLLRFGEMLDELRSFEWIDILDYDFQAPQLEDIIKIEKQIGKTLEPSIRQFYEQCNGIYFRWLDKRNEHYEMLKNNNLNKKTKCANIKR